MLNRADRFGASTFCLLVSRACVGSRFIIYGGVSHEIVSELDDVDRPLRKRPDPECTAALMRS